MPGRTSFRPFRRWFASEVVRVALLLLLIAVSISSSGLLTRVDHLVFDLGQRLNWRPVPDDVLIVAIDEDSLDLLGRWPWSRDRHARLLRTLCASDPAVVAIDIAFSEKSDEPFADAALADAIAACGRVVLPLVIESTRVGGQLLETPPIQPLAAVAAGIGRIGVRLDEDGIARSVDLREGVGTAAWPLLAEETLRLAGRLPATSAGRAGSGAAGTAAASHLLVREEMRRFEFVGPPGSVPRVSYAQVLVGNMPPEMFAGKIVLVGATAVGLGDFLPTPVSALSQPMPGVEVQANVLLSMRDGRLITALPTLPTLLLAALLAVVPLLWLPRLMPLAGLLASSLWVLAVGTACALLPGLLQRWFPPAGVLLAGLFAFPLWSWRRLEAARRHLDQELRQLRASLPQREVAVALPAEIRRLGFEQRIAWVQAAQRTMQALEAQRNEALAFISHDLRAPLAGVLSQLESGDACDQARLLPALRRALGMAQSFLWLARAEALDRKAMEEIELTSLMHQAVDEFHSLARQRQLPLVRQLPDEPVWIDGDFESLQRSVANLVHNALHHAPRGTAVTIGLDCAGDGDVELWVRNAGPALPADLVARLFKRFSRGERGASASSGTGLGLYYVRAVAEGHGGQAGVECSDGAIRFWVRLPGADRGEPERVP